MDVETQIAMYDVKPGQMGAYARQYVAAGTRVMGSCCGSPPEHVAGIVKAVK